MSITERSIIPPGSRVQIARGPYPKDPGMQGRKGTVVVNSQYDPHKVEVQLDGSPEIHVFSPEELLVASSLESLPPDHVAAKKRLPYP